MSDTGGPARVGVVGLGSMGCLHASRVNALGHDVVAGADISARNLQQFEADNEVETFESFEDMYETADLDAVVISTPNAIHAPASVEALSRDISVLTEKPMAATLDGAETVAAAARDTSAVAMVGFHNRFAPSIDVLRGLRNDGTLGEVVHVEARYLRRRGIPDVSSWFTDASLSGGGALIDIGVHALDAALAAAGYPDPVEVSGVTRHLFVGEDDYADPDGWSGRGAMNGDVIDVEDGATAFIRCENGCTIHLDVAWACDREESRTVRVQGTNGGASFDLGGDTLRLRGAGTAGTDHYVDSELAPATRGELHTEQLAYFLDCVTGGCAPDRNTVEEALVVQRVVDAIYRSAATGEARALKDVAAPVLGVQESVASD